MNPNNHSPVRVKRFGIAQEDCKPQNILWTDEPWRGRVLFTGPDGIGDHRVTVEPEHRFVGIGTMSEEGTSDTDYVWRAAPGTPFPRPRTAKVGEIGWAVPERQDWEYANTARQIMLGEFRQEVEDRHSHLYQNPWYPGPNEKIVAESDAALVMNVYRSESANPRQSRTSTSTSDKKTKVFRRNPMATPFTNHYRGYGGATSDANILPGTRTQNYLAVHQ